MKKALSALVVAAVSMGGSVASAALYVEYYRDNLLLGLAYHRVGCLTSWSTIQANQDYDGFLRPGTVTRGRARPRSRAVSGSR